MEQLFYELLRISLGTQKSLSRVPQKMEWSELFCIATKQSLVGICFVGLQKLCKNTQDAQQKLESEWNLDRKLYLMWMGLAVKIMQRNEMLNQQCIFLQKKLSADGIRSSILKGQGIAQSYSKELRNFRQSGDIDIYVDCGREKAIKYAKSFQSDILWDYKHLHLKIFKDTEVEMHYVPEVFLNLIKNRRLQKWFKTYDDELFTQNGQFVTPSNKINLVYILLHAYCHFLYQGVGLRQIMDYYFVLNAAIENSTREQVCKILSHFGMLRFTKGVMWIMSDVFGINEDCIICEINESEGKYILTEIMAGGNFGHFNKYNLVFKKQGKIYSILRVLRHNSHLCRHYPTEVMWPPIYFVWHKLWKIKNKKHFS